MNTRRTTIDDLAGIGHELTDAHLALATGGAKPVDLTLHGLPKGRHVQQYVTTEGAGCIDEMVYDF